MFTEANICLVSVTKKKEWAVLLVTAIIIPSSTLSLGTQFMYHYLPKSSHKQGFHISNPHTKLYHNASFLSQVIVHKPFFFIVTVTLTLNRLDLNAIPSKVLIYATHKQSLIKIHQS